MSFIFQEDTLDSFRMDLKEERKLGNRKIGKSRLAVSISNGKDMVLELTRTRREETYSVA